MLGVREQLCNLLCVFQIFALAKKKSFFALQVYYESTSRDYLHKLRRDAMNVKIIVCAGVLILAIAIVLTAWNIGLVVPVPPPYSKGVGARYAILLAKQTQKLSLLLIVVGWIFVSIGVLLVTAGAILGSKTPTDNNNTVIAAITSQRGLVCTALAVVIGGVGWQCIDRSRSATRTSSVATAAIATATIEGNGGKDIKAYEACVQAKSAWLEGRMNQERLQNIVDSLNKTNNDTQPNTQPSDTK